MTGPVRIMLRVSPGSSRTAVIGRYLDGWKLSVAAVPERGKANVEIVRLLADVLALPRRQIAIVTGHSARTKIVEVDGLTLAAVNEALARVCDSAG
jgi:uncharacterized protein YggU (UPF0235/DUF167 family)